MNNVNAINYKIHLEPDLQTFKFFGSAEVLLETAMPVSKITLRALELAIWSCKVRVGGEFKECRFCVDPDAEEMTVLLPDEMTAEITLKIDYMGYINDRMAGFYRSRYTSQGKDKYIAVTQFQESNARMAFPCLDHPVKKATFDIEMIVDEKSVAISNAPIDEERELGGGKKLVRFQQTPEMSTYLVFFSVGEYEFLEDPGDVLVRVAAMPEMIQYARFGLEFGRKSLELCENLYGIRYPLRKLDLIAIPDFAFGAMENWGAITFRENLLLHYPDITSRAGEERICEIIAHEIVHQWFGNLVTPSDWKYLWLNESFATYFGYAILDHYYPEWDMWDQFLNGQMDNALERDALHETVPIEIPGREHVAINVSTAPIIYNKGASIMRQVKAYMGNDSFALGLRNYLTKNEYGCTASHQLWESFEEVSKEAVTGMMKSWIEQPGYPLVQVERKGNQVILTQRRFTYLPNESRQEWVIPVNIRIFTGDGDTKSITTVLNGGQTCIDIGEKAAAYKVNDRQTGFYRVKYNDRDVFLELGKRVLNNELPPEDRWGLQNDLYALVRSGDASIDDYLGFLSNYASEHAFLPLMSIANNLFHAYMVMKGAKKAKVASLGKSFFEKVLARIGYEPGQDEKHTISVLRDQIMLHTVIYGSGEVKRFALAGFSTLMTGQAIHPDIMKSVMQIGALNGDDEAYGWLIKRLDSSESEHERMNILMALGSFSERGLIEKAQQYILDSVPDRNKFVPIVAMVSNPHAVPYMWDWYRLNVDMLEQFHPLHYERVIAAIIPVCGIGREEEVKTFFEGYMSQKEMAGDAIRMSLERLEINSRMRRSI